MVADTKLIYLISYLYDDGHFFFRLYVIRDVCKTKFRTYRTIIQQN